MQRTASALHRIYTGGAVGGNRHMLTSAQNSGYANAVFADGHVEIVKQFGLYVYNVLP